MSNINNKQTATLGQKIKMLRKELKMTQSELTGSEMTKSMLSQIENNLATPSMKNLQYIASKLGKPTSYFLDEESAVNSEQLPMEEITTKIKEINYLYDTLKMNEAKAALDKLLSDYKFDTESKIYADLLFKLGKCLMQLNLIDEGEKKVNSAIKIYTNLQLYIDAATAYMELTSRPWREFDYDACLTILDKSWDLYKNSINKDTVYEIEYLHSKFVMYSALGKTKLAIEALDKAIEISGQSGIYYIADELYRKKAALSLIDERIDDFKYNLKKAKQFAEFTEDKNVMTNIEAMCAIFENKIGDPHKALEHLERYKNIAPSPKFDYLYYCEAAIAYYKLGQYDKAYEHSQKASYPGYVNHMFDYLRLWTTKVYEGLCLHKLGRSKEGIEAIEIGIKMMNRFDASKPLAFAYKCLSEIYSETSNYEEAFKALKKSEEIKEHVERLERENNRQE